MFIGRPFISDGFGDGAAVAKRLCGCFRDFIHYAGNISFIGFMLFGGRTACEIKKWIHGMFVAISEVGKETPAKR
jgi:hypothetical protein